MIDNVYNCAIRTLNSEENFADFFHLAEAIEKVSSSGTALALVEVTVSAR